ncbi:MAG: type I-E CRISPR-associated protein Cas6/Cse3/CasE, partial [Bradymonadaceae bacterium]
AEPSLYEAVDWDRTATKEMPERFPQEMNLGFEARVCPVIRKSSAGEGRNQKGEKRTWEAGDELDAFLAEAWTSDEDAEIEREKVYRGWFERQLDNRGGARAVAETVGLKRFTIADMTRRTHGDDRKVRTIKRPDATLVGELQVTDSEQFRELLKSGIGRHKSFGYGMLKVRPA